LPFLTAQALCGAKQHFAGFSRQGPSNGNPNSTTGALDQFFRGAVLPVRRRRRATLDLANGVEKVAGAFEIRAKTPVQQNEQQGDERDNYKVLHSTSRLSCSLMP